MKIKIFSKLGKSMALGSVILLTVGVFAFNTSASVANIVVTSPTNMDMWSGVHNIEWTDSTDYEGVTPSYEISYSSDFLSYSNIIGGVSNSPYSWDTSDISDGVYKIKIESVSGNYGVSESFMVDNTSPSTSYDIVPASPDVVTGWYNIATGKPTITLECMDNLSGCEKINWDYDGNVIPGLDTYNDTVSIVVDDGEHSFVWASTDNAGNVETQNGPNEIKIDTQAPSITITDDESSVANIAGGDVVFTFTFDEDVTGFEESDVIVTGGSKGAFVSVSDTEYTLVVTPDSNSTADITVDVPADSAIDVAGNGNLMATQAVQEVDTEAPVIDPAGIITLSNDVNGDGVASIGDEITYTGGTDSTGDMTTWTVNLSNYGLSATAGPGTYAIVADDDDGVFSVEETATDDVGNSTIGSVTVSGFTDIDNVAPVVTDANISIAGGQMIDGVRVYTTGDTAIAIWNNSSAGDNNPDIVTVIATLTGSGLDTLADPLKTTLKTASLPMTDTTDCGGIANDNIYEACYDFTSVPDGIELTDVFLVVTAYDDAMNSGTDTDTTVSRLDTLAPSAPTITLLDPINSLNETSVTITGIGEANASIDYTIDDGSNSVTGTGTVDNSGNINLTGIDVSALNDGIVTATITLTDQAGNSDTGSVGTDTATKDTVLPTILSITTKDVDDNGDVDTAVIVFSEDVLDSTLSASDFTLGGIPATAVASGTADDDTIEISHSGVAGTEAKDVTYTSGILTDILGNPLADVTSGGVAEIDEAGPVPISAKTVSITEIEVLFSEDLLGTSDNPSDFDVDGNLVDATVENTGVVTLTLDTPIGTGDTPLVTVFGDGATIGLKDLNGNWSPKEYTLTPDDGVAPVLTSVTIESDNDGDIIAPEWAKVGDTVTLNFTTSEDIATPTVMINGQTAIISNGPSDWTAEYSFVGGEPEGVVPFTIDFEDLVSPANVGVQVSSTSDGSEVFYDETNPIVDAGSDKETNMIVLQDADTSDSVPASGIAVWAWTQESGPGTVTFSSVATEDTNISADTDGVYILRLTVTDNAGNTAYDEMEFIWDTTNPVVITSVPFDGADGIAIDAGVANIVFDDAGNITLIDPNKVTFVNDTTETSYKTAVTVSGGDGNSKILNLDYSILENNTRYRINVKPGAVRDVSGNILDTNFIGYFETGGVPDTTAPNTPVITTTSTTVDADTYTIAGTVAEDGGIRIINLYNGTSLVGNAVVSIGQTNWSVIASLTQDSDNVFTATAIDGVGNISDASNSVTITEATTPDTDKPIIAVLGQNPLTLTVGDTFIDPGATAIDAIDGNISSDIVFGGTIADGDVTTSAGTFTVTYDVSDSAGNSADQESRTVIVNEAFDDTATLAVTKIDAVKTYAIADDTFENGWSWIYHVTVPTSETQFKMKFSDFVSGTNTILAKNNIRFYSTQASANSDSASAIMITDTNTYSTAITLDADIEPSIPGRQIEVIVEMKVPVGSAGGSYSASYGIESL